jgi:hypothetical protein
MSLLLENPSNSQRRPSTHLATKGGGTVKIGGDWQGKGTTQRAETLSVDGQTIIHSDATELGDGGTVVLWSDKQTSFDGLITARGGDNSGDGDNVEISGKAKLDFTGFVDLTANTGKFGQLLLDPYNVVISSASAKNTTGFSASSNDSIINVSTLQTQLNAASVAISTGSPNNLGLQAGNISVNSPLLWSANTTLTLQAAGGIYFNSAVTATGDNANLVIQHGSGKDYYVYQPITLSGSASTVSIADTKYTMLRSMADIDAVNSNLNGYYALAHDITSTELYSDARIGSGETVFSGTFAGLGNKIRDFSIVKTATDIQHSAQQPYGLFGINAGLIRDIGLVGGGIETDHSDLTAIGASIYAGHLVGMNVAGTVKNSFSTGKVSASNLVSTDISLPAEFYIGGLIGASSEGTLRNIYATGDVTGTEYIRKRDGPSCGRWVDRLRRRIGGIQCLCHWKG